MHVCQAIYHPTRGQEPARVHVSSGFVTTTTTWARWLRDALAEREWSQADLVRRSNGDFADSEVSRWLSGKVNPKIPNIRKVCALLGVAPVEGIIAAGHLEPDDVGATVISRPRQTHELPELELIEELRRRALERGGQPSDEGDRPDHEDFHVVTPSTGSVTTGRFQAPTYGQEGEDYAARRTNRPGKQDGG